MQNLKIIKHNGQFVTDSREVAEMVEIRHSDLLEKIGGYIHHLESGSFRSQDFFIHSSYSVEGNSKTYPCYLLTRKGCDMVANKVTGKKGVLFTATYVTKFEEMEKNIKQISQRSSFGDLASLMKEWRQWAKSMNMPPYTAMKELIKFLQDKGEPVPNTWAYLPQWSMNQLELPED